MTKRQYDIVNKYRQHTKDAHYSKTVNDLTPFAKKELYDLYLEMGYQGKSLNCGSCVIAMLSLLDGLAEQFEQQLTERDKANKERFAYLAQLKAEKKAAKQAAKEAKEAAKKAEANAPVPEAEPENGNFKITIEE